MYTVQCTLDFHDPDPMTNKKFNWNVSIWCDDKEEEDEEEEGKDRAYRWSGYVTIRNPTTCK